MNELHAEYVVSVAHRLRPDPTAHDERSLPRDGQNDLDNVIEIVTRDVVLKANADTRLADISRRHHLEEVRSQELHLHGSAGMRFDPRKAALVTTFAQDTSAY